MYAATMKDEGNAADGRFSTACFEINIKDLILRLTSDRNDTNEVG